MVQLKFKKGSVKDNVSFETGNMRTMFSSDSLVSVRAI